MSQIITKFISDGAVLSGALASHGKIGSGAATATSALFGDGSGGTSFRAILSTDIPTLNQNTTGTASNITATSNSTLTTLSALTTASSLASVGTITSGTWTGTTIAIAHGGTGQTTANAAFNALSPMTTAGDIIYEASAGVAAALPIGSTGQVLTVVSGIPAWSTATVGANRELSNLATGGDVAINTSLLPGVDNSINLGSSVFSWAAANIHTLNDSGGSTSVDVYNRQLLEPNGSLSVDWGNHLLSDSAFGTSIDWANRLLVDTSTNTQLSWSTAGVELNQLTPNTVLYLNGSNIITSSAVTPTQLGYLSGASGTTGTGNLVFSDSPTFTTLVTTAALSATTGSFTGAVNMNSKQINNLANGTVSSDAINLGQLQAAIAGLYWQGPAKAYADSNVPLTGGATLTIDGYAVQNGDLVILGNQMTASQNGEYTASGVGTAYVLTPNGLPTAAGDAWLILNGTVYGDSAFVANAAVPAATFTEFAGPTAYTFTAPLSLSGRTVSITQATTSTNGYLSSTDWNTFNNKQAAGNYITALTGDGTASGPGSAAFTLATVNTNVGSFGSASSVPSFTVNAKGLITAASSSAIVAPAGTLSGTTLNSSVVSSSLTSVGTITSGTWNGTTIAIANGGTGQTTKQAAFDALSPLGTAGDTLYFNGTNNVALPAGTNGYVLTMVSGEPAWSATAATATWNKETFNPLTSGQITAQSITLAHTPLANSVSFLVVGAGDQLEGIDFTVTGAVVAFIGGLATGGASALTTSDIVQIQYQY